MNIEKGCNYENNELEICATIYNVELMILMMFVKKSFWSIFSLIWDCNINKFKRTKIINFVDF
jgi:hypothetical protein